MKKQIKVLFINSKDKTIKEVLICEFEEISSMIDCQRIEACDRRIGSDTVFIDEEGLYVEDPAGAFTYTSAGQIFSGNGVIVGLDDQDVILSIDQAYDLVQFVPVGELPDAEFSFITY